MLCDEGKRASKAGDIRGGTSHWKERLHSLEIAELIYDMDAAVLEKKHETCLRGPECVAKGFLSARHHFKGVVLSCHDFFRSGIKMVTLSHKRRLKSSKTQEVDMYVYLALSLLSITAE